MKKTRKHHLKDGELKRSYRGKEYVVKVTKGKISFNGLPYRSLTAVARVITGYKAISGPAFFEQDKEAVAA